MPLVRQASQIVGTTASSQPAVIPEGSLWYDTSTDKLKSSNGSTYSNVGTSSFAASAVVSHTTTIGDYTAPTSSTVSSTGTNALTVFDTFATDNFTDVGSGIAVSGGVLGGSINRSLTNNGSYRTITALSDTVWAAQFKMIINSVSAETNGVFIGFTDLDGNTDANGNRDGLGLFIRYDGALLSTICAPNGATWGTTTTDMTTAPSVTTLYVTMRRISATSFTIAYSSTDSYTEDIEVKNFTVSSGIVGLDNFVMQGMIGVASVDDFAIYIDDLRIWDATNTTTVRTQLIASNVYDLDTSTRWQSTSESNPNIYVDMGSALNLCAVAFYWDATNSTETEIKIQTSIDAVTWTDKRKITTSNLTNGAYNYYRFNIAGGARYVRFYGTGTSKVSSIYEIKVQTRTDAQIFADLGIVEISASDTSLDNDGV